MQTKTLPQPQRPQMPVPATGTQSANKVVVQTLRPTAPAVMNTTTSTAAAPARAKTGVVSAAVTAALQAHTQKAEAAGQAYREKRKFEALK